MKLTEGHRYTAVILAVVAALLAAGLTRYHSPPAELASTPGPRVTTTRPPTTVSAADRPDLSPSPGVPPAALPVTSSPPTVPVTTPTTRGTGGTGGTGGGIAPDAPCPAGDAVQGARRVFEQLDGLLGGIVPSAALTTTVAILTGCSQTDPVVLLLAALVELGNGLPDLGLGFFEFPVLPFLMLPGPVVTLVQPLLPVVQPVCDTVGTVGLLVSQVGPAYPYPLDKAFAVSLFYLTSTCGQLQGL